MGYGGILNRESVEKGAVVANYPVADGYSINKGDVVDVVNGEVVSKSAKIFNNFKIEPNNSLGRVRYYSHYSSGSFLAFPTRNVSRDIYSYRVMPENKNATSVSLIQGNPVRFLNNKSTSVLFIQGSTEPANIKFYPVDSDGTIEAEVNFLIAGNTDFYKKDFLCCWDESRSGYFWYVALKPDFATNFYVGYCRAFDGTTKTESSYNFNIDNNVKPLSLVSIYSNKAVFLYYTLPTREIKYRVITNAGSSIEVGEEKSLSITLNSAISDPFVDTDNIYKTLTFKEKENFCMLFNSNNKIYFYIVNYNNGNLSCKEEVRTLSANFSGFYSIEKVKDYYLIYITNERVLSVKINFVDKSVSAFVVNTIEGRKELVSSAPSAGICYSDGDNIYIVGETSWHSSLSPLKFVVTQTKMDDNGLLYNSITYTSTQAIALNSGTSGQNIDIVYSGPVEYEAPIGTKIESNGVKGYVPVENVLDVIPWYFSGLGVKATTGAYTGTGEYGKDHPVKITLPFEPILLFVAQKDGGSRLGEGDYSAYWWKGNTELMYINSNVGIQVIKNTISWFDNSSAYDQFNAAGMTYTYFALGY